MSVFFRGPKLLKTAGVLCAALLLTAACSSTPEPEVATVETGATAAPAGPAPGTPEDFAASVQDRVFFALDRHNLDEGDKEVLRQQANWLSQYPSVTITVEGHCDERGTREYNMALGAERAEAVKAFLVGQGIDENRIRVVSYGKERPVDPRSSEDAWRINRRGVTLVKASAGY